MKINEFLEASIFKYFFLIVLVLYSFTRIYLFATLPYNSGDESLFIDNLNFFLNNGYIEAVKSKVSIPHLLLVYPLTFLFNEHISLRLLNLVLALFLLYYIYKRFKSLNLIYLLIFYFVTANDYLIGTNDGVFFFFLSLFFIEVYCLIKQNKFNYLICFGGLIGAVFTRQLIVMYLFSILFSLYVLYSKKELFKRKHIIYTAGLILFGLVLNIPSIVANRQLSYDNKVNTTDPSVNWVERQYLSQLEVNNNRLANYNHVSWEAVKAYKLKNGENSLPKNFIEVFFFDIKATLKEMAKDSTYVMLYSIRQVGISFLLGLILLFSIFKNKTKVMEYYIPIVGVLTMFTFTAIIFSYIELRWFFSVFLMTPFLFYDSFFVDKYRFLNHLKSLNFLLIIFVMLFGIFNVVYKENIFNLF